MKTTACFFATFLFTFVFSQSPLPLTDSTETMLPGKEQSLKQQASVLSLKDSSYYYYRDLNALQWENFARATYHYNTSGKENGFMSIISLSGNWQGNERHVNYSFDANNNLLGYVLQSQNSNWANVQKYTYSYDNDNNRLTELTQNWVPATNSWRNNTLMTHSYDTHHNRLTSVNQQWSISGSVWMYTTKETATYNTNNEYTSRIIERRNNSTSSWESFKRYLFVYANGDLTSLTEEEYDSNTSAYRPVYRETNSYDGNHRITGSISEKTNTTGMAWENAARETYTYDSNGNQIVHLNEKWDLSNGTWKNSFRQFDYYSHKTLGIHSAGKAEYIRLYPNPATDHISILNESGLRFTSLSILDINGQQVLTQTTENTTDITVPLSALAPGVYMLALKTREGLVYKKFIRN